METTQTLSQIKALLVNVKKNYYYNALCNDDIVN